MSRWKGEHTLVLYLLLTYATASNILRTPKKNYAKFVLKHANKKHTTAPYKTITARNLFKCLDICTFETTCKSANYKETGTNQNPCELLSNDRNDLESYTDAQGWGHYDTGRTTLTQFRAASYGNICIVPVSHSCEAKGDNLVTSTNSDMCEQDFAYFDFDVETGRLYHRCSGLAVCHVNSIMTLRNCVRNKVENYNAAYVRDWSKCHSLSCYIFQIFF